MKFAFAAFLLFIGTIAAHADMAIVSFKSFRWGDSDGAEPAALTFSQQKAFAPPSGVRFDGISIVGILTLKKRLTPFFNIPMGRISAFVQCEKRWGGDAGFCRLSPLEIGEAPRNGSYLAILSRGGTSILDCQLIGPLEEAERGLRLTHRPHVLLMLCP
jgi:hypothetical protein